MRATSALQGIKAVARVKLPGTKTAKVRRARSAVLPVRQSKDPRMGRRGVPAASRQSQEDQLARGHDRGNHLLPPWCGVGHASSTVEVMTEPWAAGVTEGPAATALSSSSLRTGRQEPDAPHGESVTQ